MTLQHRMERLEGQLGEFLRRTARPEEPAGPPSSLLEFMTRTHPAYRPATLHRYVATRLEGFLHACEREEAPRLLLTLPPRHGKSALASVGLPAFALGRNPDWPIIHASYTAALSNDFSRQVRNLLREEAFQHCYPGILPASDSSSVHRWGVEGRRGVFVSVGVGGPLTGRGAKVLIIDDPLKGHEEADSELFRARQREWFASTAYTRLEKGAGVLLIMTRWHLADLGGYVTEGGGTDEPPAEAWERIDLPAIALEGDPLGRAPGEPLWPERFSLAALERSKRQLPPRWWLALYQQQPVAAEGNFLEVGRIGQAEARRADLRVSQGWDLAISTKTTADWSCCVTVGVDGDQNLYLLDVARGRWNFNQLLAQMGDLADVWKPTSIAIETSGYQSAAFQEACRRYFLPFREVQPDKDKQTRAQLLANRIAAGKVFADKTAPWWRAFEAEALAFPTGQHDDQVDACVYAVLETSSPLPAQADFIEPDDEWFAEVHTGPHTALAPWDDDPEAAWRGEMHQRAKDAVAAWAGGGR